MNTPDTSSHDTPCLPRLIAWEVTRTCILACKHCRGASQTTPYSGELSTDECRRLLDNIASFARPTIILTGGEPMLREDIYDIARYACGLGLHTVMAPCGPLLNDETAPRILASGIRHISISLDGATAESHDAFRGVPGVFDDALRGLEAAKRAGLEFQINTTVTRHNVGELPDILELAVRLGARVFNPFLLVPAGRGKALAGQEISAQDYERTLQWLARQEDRADIGIRVTCAPHYQRILRQTGRGALPGPHSFKGCMGGRSFAFVSHRGKVQICGFLDVECGDVRTENFDFEKIWETSEVFRRIRDVDSYHGRCGYCDYRTICGGCRARAFALTGDYLAEEPFCVYQPERPPAASPRDADRKLDELDTKILSSIQADLPVAERPFDVLAARLGADPGDVLARVARLRERGIIRRLGPLFASARLGYTSTLVAAAVPPDRLIEVADLVSALPGVTHNYRREHAYNLWFTLTVASIDEIGRIIADLKRRTGIATFHSLPALAVYKIRVDFQTDNEEPAPEAPAPQHETSPVRLSQDQKELVRLLQEDVPAVAEPFAPIARKLGWPVQDVVAQIAGWLAQGVIRRFGAVVRHRRLGFDANGLAVFRAAPDRIDDHGRRLARYPEISHCYRRPPLPDFPYNLFAMVHGRSPAQVRGLVDRLSAQVNASQYDVLFSTTEFKKTSMRYFVQLNR